jgi:uncharacterized protein YndB with AHSA1/START domain
VVLFFLDGVEFANLWQKRTADSQIYLWIRDHTTEKSRLHPLGSRTHDYFYIINNNTNTMEQNRTVITVETTVNAPVEKVWKTWNAPEDINQWCTATPEWHTINAANDLRPGGKLSSRMEAKDGSMGFDFVGIYDTVKENEWIAYTLGDGRKVTVQFTGNGNTTKVVETFEAEDTNPVEMQQGGWQAILDNFKTYTENN